MWRSTPPRFPGPFTSSLLTAVTAGASELPTRQRDWWDNSLHHAPRPKNASAGCGGGGGGGGAWLVVGQWAPTTAATATRHTPHKTQNSQHTTRTTHNTPTQNSQKNKPRRTTHDARRTSHGHGHGHGQRPNNANANAPVPDVVVVDKLWPIMRPPNRTPSTGSPPSRCLYQTPAAMGGRAEHGAPRTPRRAPGAPKCINKFQNTKQIYRQLRPNKL